LNGELVNWDDATIHVGSHGLHIGSGVYQGIRCYETVDGPCVFRLEEHLRRLHNSARLLYMEIPYSVDELRQAVQALITANDLRACYIRPIAFYGVGALGVLPTGCSVETSILCWPWGAYLGEGALEAGVTVKTSSYQRVGPNVIPHVAKATGIYLNSMLACLEAQRSGYDEALMLTGDGFVADGPGENVFLVKDNVIFTPHLSASILPGITRDSIIELARDAGYEVREQNVIRSDVYLADEVFFTGTAAEVTPGRSVDDVEIGVGPVALELQQRFFDVVHGRDNRWSHWLDAVAS
jgi:branched-chain amino acid aminotransferase